MGVTDAAGLPPLHYCKRIGLGHVRNACGCRHAVRKMNDIGGGRDGSQGARAECCAFATRCACHGVARRPARGPTPRIRGIGKGSRQWILTGTQGGIGARPLLGGPGAAVGGCLGPWPAPGNAPPQPHRKKCPRPKMKYIKGARLRATVSSPGGTKDARHETSHADTKA